METNVLLLAVLVGVAIGAGLVWWLSRARLASAVDAAVTKAESTSRVDSAELRERLRGAAEELARRNNELALANELQQSLREQLLSARAEQGRLAQQAERIPQLEDQTRSLMHDLAQASGQIASLTEQKAKFEEQASALPELRQRLDESVRQIEALRAELHAAREGRAHEVSRLRTELEAEQRGAKEKLALLLAAKEELSNQFKTLSNEILEDKAKRFTEQNTESLGQLLGPLRTQLSEFRGKVEEVYVQEGKDRHALSEQVRLLADMNRMLSEDARKLTEALKGNSKAQGNWGELILERVLESAGLRKGHEFVVQESTRREDGSRGQPDVVINLPESRRLIVDAKVSLTAYEEYMRAESDDDRSLAGRRHLESVRSHIKGLSEKQYEALHGAQSPDFVIMFVPIDSAFMVASMQDGELFTRAWERNVLLVSPSTLLFVVRIVAHLWRQEQQNQNAQEIAARGAKLYEQLTRFIDDLDEMGKRLDQAQEAFQGAYKRLVKQKGNVVWQAEQLRKLGVKPNKVLPAALLELAEPDAEDPALPAAEPGTAPQIAAGTPADV
jgi:DNA recombination protein RmuC